jgi:predicted MPP superfamily phosphohydrolase
MNPVPRRKLVRTGVAAVTGVATGGLAWGLYEAAWVRLAELELPLRGLPAELAGLRVAHLADFHLGIPSPGTRAVERAVEWVAARQPDLVVITGDLLARPSGAERLRRLIDHLPPVYAVLGNHDYADSRDPFSKPVGEVDLGRGTLLADDALTLELRGRRVQLVGVDPRTYMRLEARPWELADPTADLRILLCHFPRVVDRLPAGVFHLVLAGHTHDGQICLPYPGGKVRLAHPFVSYNRGLYVKPGGTLHVSPGLGTTFVPLRFFARPEATELRLVGE